MEERKGLHVRKEHMVLQGEERDAILEVEIGCLFLSVPKRYECPKRIIQRVRVVHTFLAKFGLVRV